MTDEADALKRFILKNIRLVVHKKIKYNKLGLVRKKGCKIKIIAKLCGETFTANVNIEELTPKKRINRMITISKDVAKQEFIKYLLIKYS